MNLPNKLTLFRVILIPFFVFFLLTQYMEGVSRWVALGIFVVASLTDFFDGRIARKYHLVTNFGKFMDPLADKLLVCSALICFVELKILPSWFVIVIIAREFIISGFRLVASDNGVVIAASWWGKFKTAFQMVLIIILMFLMGLGKEIYWNGLMLMEKAEPYNSADITGWSITVTVIAWSAFLLTLVSLIDYLVKNRDVMKGSI